MCEFCDKLHKGAALNYFYTHPERLVTPEVMSRFPYAFQEGCCAVCGKYLEEEERKPTGRATRSLCLYDYKNLIANTISHTCLICWGPLSADKVRAQKKTPREVDHHLHEGECTYRWTIIHNVSVGEPDALALFESPHQQSRPLPPWLHVQRALPGLAPRLFFPDNANKVPDLVPVPSQYKGKNIKRIR
jgi:hypothetical protein